MQLIYTTWWIWRQLYFQEGFPGSSAGKESAPSLIPELGSSPGEGIGYPTPVFLGFSGCSDGKESSCHVGYLGLIPELERSHGVGHGNPLQYSCLENPHGQRNLAGYSPWGWKELDMTQQLSTAQHNMGEGTLRRALILSHKGFWVCAEWFQEGKSQFYVGPCKKGEQLWWFIWVLI